MEAYSLLKIKFIIIKIFWNRRASLKIMLNVKIYFQIKFPCTHIRPSIPTYRISPADESPTARAA